MKRILVFWLMGLIGVMNILSQELTEETSVEIVTENTEDGSEILLPEYEPWEVVSIEGKLKMQGLPLTPSLKIFMQRDSLVDISLRAAFMGEVGKLVLTTDSVKVINKMKKTYTVVNLQRPETESKEETEEETEENTEKRKWYDVLGVKEVQELLLGHFFLAGVDIEESEPEDVMEVLYADEQLTVVPLGPALIEGVRYGYVVDESFRPMMLVILPEGDTETEVDVMYNFANLQGYTLQFLYKDAKRRMEMTMELKNPEYKGEAPKEVDLRKFKRLGFEEFMRSF